MKKLNKSILYFCISLLLPLIMSCEGPEGPVGPQGNQGDPGAKGDPGSPCAVVDNGDGTFTMTCEDSGPVTFGETEEPDTYKNADITRGGQLYDKYWLVTGGDAPSGEHALYPSFGSATGETTWRCKECHGWDYLGKDGRYSNGSHYTGIKGLYPPDKSLWKAFIIIKDDHGFGSSGLTNDDIWDLVKFYREGLIDINTILSEDGTFLGSFTSGKALYVNGIPGYDAGGQSTNASCNSCHGYDGTNEIVAGFDAFVGFLSNENPQEFQHKVRFGHPDTDMPAATAINGSLDHIADLSAYSQTLSPVPWNTTSVSRGGQLYDQYWSVTGGIAPTNTHFLYPDDGPRSGETTWRCKECHGWDYLGKDGRYGSGSHYTGIDGLFPANKTKWQAFVEIKEGHGYVNGQLSDSDIWDLVAFYIDGMFDINFILNSDGSFNGDVVSGQNLFENGIGGGSSCASCHGTDGLNEITPGFTDFPGFLSNDNPQEFAHKVFFGQPGTNMVITYDNGASLKNVADLSAWSQTLPQN